MNRRSLIKSLVAAPIVALAPNISFAKQNAEIQVVKFSSDGNALLFFNQHFDIGALAGWLERLIEKNLSKESASTLIQVSGITEEGKGKILQDLGNLGITAHSKEIGSFWLVDMRKIAARIMAFERNPIWALREPC
jgi:hypothetical protein